MISGEPVVTPCAFFCTRAMGASGTRRSLRPLIFMGVKINANPGESRRGNAEVCSFVIASAATCPPQLEERRRKQSIYVLAPWKNGLLLHFAKEEWIASAFARWATVDKSLRSQ